MSNSRIPPTVGQVLSSEQPLPQSAHLQTTLAFVVCKNSTERLRYRFKPALNSKGLRRVGVDVSRSLMLQASPEFKGIKTGGCVAIHFFLSLQASPEFKGIKTLISSLFGSPTVASSQP